MSHTDKKSSGETKEYREGFWNDVIKPADFKSSNLNKDFILKIHEIKKKIMTINQKTWIKYSRAMVLFGLPQPDIHCIHYMGSHHCIECGIDNGCAEYIILHNGKKWIFPEGYFHYIEVHNVNPSIEFQKMILEINLDNCTFPFEISDDTFQEMNMLRLLNGMKGLSYI
ncbi:MAG: hypothetical protein Edafosvirus3_22 [Edafosvirus sp.]|uniref:Uncharacterized protein n=1 Tax=Edafosvirus sp. TaxID=2487765 RepID=A0A3G4ZUF6_9VIRU|nr:MAG: hypothetical protein Edafosvirus3_22 [Edafosvirus sp.]